MQRMVGYALTGLIYEHKLWILYGLGGNGKGVLCSVARMILGHELLRFSPFSTLTKKSHDDHPTELARLDRARLVVASEKSRVRALDESVIKQLTGGDPVAARYMRQDFFEFDPQFKLWLAVNERPPIHADHAMKRRVLMVPFNARFVDNPQPGDDAFPADPKLEQKLRAELPGVLAWAVRGCLDWQREGLGMCAAVEKETSDYMAECAPLAEFITDRCETDDRYEVEAGDLLEAYKEWCATTGNRRLNDREYSSALEVAGFSRRREKTGRVWAGLRLREGG